MNKIKCMTVTGLAAVIFAAGACQTSNNKNISTNQPVNTATTNANVNPAPSTPPPAETEPANTAGTPTAAYKAAYIARKNKDVPALKKLLSKDILEFFSEIAGLGEKKQTLDELLMELCEKPQAAIAEVRNEKIDGDKATIEYLDEKGEWSPMEFVKEDGIWKLTVEKAEKASPDVKKNKN